MQLPRVRRAARPVTAALAAAGIAAAVAGCTAQGPRSGAAASSARPVSATAPSSAASSTSAPSTSAPSTPARATTTPPVAAAVHPAATSPCATNTARQLVAVRVRAQHLWLCERNRAVYDSPVTTGAVDLPYDATPKGTFHIQEKDRNRVLTLVSGASYTVKYWIPFEAPLFGFHDSPWQAMPYGSPDYRTKGSHGCVHMPLAAIRTLYRWADVGATVRITR